MAALNVNMLVKRIVDIPGIKVDRGIPRVLTHKIPISPEMLILAKGLAVTFNNQAARMRVAKSSIRVWLTCPLVTELTRLDPKYLRILCCQFDRVV